MEQTAIQFFISRINERIENIEKFSDTDSITILTTLKVLRLDAISLLEVEKQQIINAVEWNYKSNMGQVYYDAMFGEATS